MMSSVAEWPSRYWNVSALVKVGTPCFELRSIMGIVSAQPVPTSETLPDDEYESASEGFTPRPAGRPKLYA